MHNEIKNANSKNSKFTVLMPNLPTPDTEEPIIIDSLVRPASVPAIGRKLSCD